MSLMKFSLFVFVVRSASYDEDYFNILPDSHQATSPIFNLQPLTSLNQIEYSKKLEFPTQKQIIHTIIRTLANSQQCSGQKPGYCCEEINCIYGTCRGDICVCNLFYSGPQCTIGCASNCSGRGVCNSSNKCVCNSPFGGPICDQTLVQYQSFYASQCIANVRGYCCQGVNCINGQCSNGYCSCDPGSFGNICQHGCRHNCSGNGNCVSAVCQCLNGWTGSDCSVRSICRNNCSGNGVCLESTCQCNPRWSGTDCSQNISPILCKGKLVNNQCLCETGYFGDNCALNCANCTSDNCNIICEQQSTSGNIVIVGLCVGTSLVVIISGLIYLFKRNKLSKYNYEMPDSPIEEGTIDPVMEYDLSLKRADELLKLPKPVVVMNCLICLDQTNIVIDYEKDADLKPKFHQICIDQWLERNRLSQPENK